MTRIAVQSRMLEWALEHAESSDSINNKFPKLPEWLEGSSTPTLRQLEDFAKATRVPFGALFLNNPPQYELHIPHFRTINDREPEKPSSDLIETVHTMQRRQAWLREYLNEHGAEALSYIGQATANQSPETLASLMREALKLNIGWASAQRNWTDALRLLQESMSHAGISVVVNGVVGNNTHRKLKPQEFRGFVLVDEYAPLVFINGSDWKSAQIFTLAHELAHLIIGFSAAFDLRGMLPAEDATEKLCNAAAAEFLVPASELAALWPSIRESLDRFNRAARHFKVSEVVVARRALDLGFIERAEFFAFYEDYRQKIQKIADEKDESGGNFHATQNYRLGKLFAETIIRAVKRGDIQYGEAYRLTGLYGKTFESYAERLNHVGLV